jgi:hypothetical protein
MYQTFLLGRSSPVNALCIELLHSRLSATRIVLQYSNRVCGVRVRNGPQYRTSIHGSPFARFGVPSRFLCQMLATMWTGFAFPLLSLLYTANAWLASTVPKRPQSELLRFELRHYHAVSNSSRIIFADAPPSLVNIGLDSYEMRARELISYRPSSHVAFAQARTRSLRNGQNEHLSWDEVNVLGPDVESRDVLLHLAKMTNNAYLLPDEDGWYDLGDKWSPVRSLLFGTLWPLMCIPLDRAINLVGSQTKTASAGTSSRHQTTAPSCFPSKAHPWACSAVAGPPPPRTNSMITFCLVVVVHTWIGRGLPCAGVTRVDGSVVWGVLRRR